MSSIVHYKQRHLTLRAFVFITLSVTLMFFDYHHYVYVVRLRTALSNVITPLQHAVQSPVALWRETVDLLRARKKILLDNENLRAEMLILRAENQQVLALMSDNEQLTELLKTTQTMTNHFSVASVIASNVTAFGQQEMIDQGARDKVFNGQVVIDGSGLLGQLIAVLPSSSRMLLITDSNSAVPVQIVRNGLRAIVVGDGAQGLRLVNMTKLADIQAGDSLITSGMGGKFPPGVPVGTIYAVNSVDGQQFLTISAKPLAKVQAIRRVLLVWPEANDA